MLGSGFMVSSYILKLGIAQGLGLNPANSTTACPGVAPPHTSLRRGPRPCVAQALGRAAGRLPGSGGLGV